MPKEFIPHIISGDSITIFHNGAKIFPSSHILYKEICKAVKDKNRAALTKLLSDKPKNLQGLQIKEDKILYNGEPLNTVAVRRLFEIKKAGFDTTSVINFLKNCYKNDHPVVVEKLYEFLESRGLPLTEDGCFIAYKYTKGAPDYWDSYTGCTYQYLPGAHLKANNIENRKIICDLSGEECSKEGMHVGNREYSGDRVDSLFVKVNPKDVLSVPHGFGAKKIRVWELDVLGRVDGQTFSEPVVSDKGKEIKFVQGRTLDCRYKGDGKEIRIAGTIKNVSNMYLELSDYCLRDSNGKWYDYNGKRRLKISNILEVI